MVACERHCCLCHNFKGTKIECHHIVQAADGGPDTLGNCIPLCFDCHAEVGAYNPKHARGTKFSAKELKKRRDDWYQEVRNRRVLRDFVHPKSEPIELGSFEEARSLAESNPTDKIILRRGVVRGWQLLANGVLKMTNVLGENASPIGEVVTRALKKLWGSTRVPEELCRSIEGLQKIAYQAAVMSHWAGYDPDLSGVLEFIQECERVRDELVRIYNSGGL